MSWMNKPEITFARTKLGRVTHVLSAGHTVCGIHGSDCPHRSALPGYFKTPICARCVGVVTGQLDHTTRLAEKVFAAAHTYGTKK